MKRRACSLLISMPLLAALTGCTPFWEESAGESGVTVYVEPGHDDDHGHAHAEGDDDHGHDHDHAGHDGDEGHSGANHGADDGAGDHEAGEAGEEGEDAARIARMNQAFQDIMAREEHKDMDISLEHVLFTFEGVQSDYYINRRSKQDAERIAAICYDKLVRGEEDMEALISISDDRWYPKYTVSMASRYDLADGFGKILWRLQPGEFAPLPYEHVESPYGWHIIYRTK